MSTPVRLVVFLGVLAAVLVAGLGLGRAVGPIGPASSDASHGEPAATDDHADDGGHAGDDEGGHADDAGGHADDGGHAEQPTGVTGLAVSEGGYTFRPGTTSLVVGTQDFRFTVVGADGEPVTAYDATHERDLHLIVVRRDTSGFQHLHPEQGDDGTWSTPLTLDAPGAYRAYADFAPEGEPARTLAVDLVVPGEYAPEPLPAPSRTAEVDGYTVTLDGDLRSGDLVFEVSRDGRPVDDLEPYLGAGGHLVVLREGDLGYLHVHPEGDLDTGPEIAFVAEAPSDGRYRLFLQFQHGGTVRTAAFTADTEETS
jgi:hypothetical protein